MSESIKRRIHAAKWGGDVEKHRVICRLLTLFWCPGEMTAPAIDPSGIHLYSWQCTWHEVRGAREHPLRCPRLCGVSSSIHKKHLVQGPLWRGAARTPSRRARTERLGQEANRILQLYLIADGMQALHSRTSIKGDLSFLGSVVVIRDGNMRSGIDHFLHSHNVCPCFSDHFTFKVGKMELCDPLGRSPPPCWQPPLILESLTPFTK